jgi:hypothetical protein
MVCGALTEIAVTPHRDVHFIQIAYVRYIFDQLLTLERLSSYTSPYQLEHPTTISMQRLIVEGNDHSICDLKP